MAPIVPIIQQTSVADLLSEGSIANEGWSVKELHALGLQLNGNQAVLPTGIERLDRQDIVGALSVTATEMWPSVSVVPMIESTNTALLGASAQAQGAVLAAEYQYGGRGRRGRTWISPIARNVAMSAAWVTDHHAAELGGLSLMVGLAVADVLQTAGVSGVALKWPNDVLLNSAKLAGVLIELQPLPQGCLVVVGIGVNYASASITRALVPQPIADLFEVQPAIGRNELLALLLNALADYLTQFELDGFGGMVDAWQSLHAFHEKEVVLLAGTQTRVGRVVGVTARGHLQLATAKGIETFSAGEVSLRPTAAGAPA